MAEWQVKTLLREQWPAAVRVPLQKAPGCLKESSDRLAAAARAAVGRHESRVADQPHVRARSIPLVRRPYPGSPALLRRRAQRGPGRRISPGKPHSQQDPPTLPELTARATVTKPPFWVCREKGTRSGPAGLCPAGRGRGTVLSRTACVEFSSPAALSRLRRVLCRRSPPQIARAGHSLSRPRSHHDPLLATVPGRSVRARHRRGEVRRDDRPHHVPVPRRDASRLPHADRQLVPAADREGLRVHRGRNPPRAAAPRIALERRSTPGVHRRRRSARTHRPEVGPVVRNGRQLRHPKNDQASHARLFRQLERATSSSSARCRTSTTAWPRRLPH